MAKRRVRKLHSNVVHTFGRLINKGGLLCRQFSRSEEAQERGEQYIYFAVKDGTKLPTGASKFLIDNGLAVPGDDGLFPDTPQTFRIVDLPTFESFKAQYEASV